MFSLLHRETITERAARAWADQACWTEQYVERSPVVLPEVTEALQIAKTKAKRFRQLVEGSGKNGDE